MSEQAELAYLQENIKQAKSDVGAGGILSIAGAAILGATLGLSSVIGWGTDMTTMVVLGILAVAAGFSILVNSTYKATTSMKEFRRMTIPTLKCLRCGKET